MSGIDEQIEIFFSNKTKRWNYRLDMFYEFWRILILKFFIFETKTR